MQCSFSSTKDRFACSHPPSYSAHSCKLAGQDKDTVSKHESAWVTRIFEISVTLGARLIILNRELKVHLWSLFKIYFAGPTLEIQN